MQKQTHFHVRQTHLNSGKYLRKQIPTLNAILFFYAYSPPYAHASIYIYINMRTNYAEGGLEGGEGDVKASLSRFKLLKRLIPTLSIISCMCRVRMTI